MLEVLERATGPRERRVAGRRRHAADAGAEVLGLVCALLALACAAL